MASIDERSRGARAEPMVDDGFDELARRFSGRLNADREHLVGLAAALARTPDDHPRTVFEALRHCAHRMHGAAAIFDFRELAQAAHALERAADAALRGSAPNTDAQVWAALVGLVQFLAERSGTCRSGAPGRYWS